MGHTWAHPWVSTSPRACRSQIGLGWSMSFCVLSLVKKMDGNTCCGGPKLSGRRDCESSVEYKNIIENEYNHKKELWYLNLILIFITLLAANLKFKSQTVFLSNNYSSCSFIRNVGGKSDMWYQNNNRLTIGFQKTWTVGVGLLDSRPTAMRTCM
jgi:hypothetical protein